MAHHRRAPKGVPWTHANALWAARVNAVHEDLHPSDCHLTYLPLFHANALGYQMLASMWVGSRFVLVPKWSTSRFWDVSVQHGCTWLSLAGMFFPGIESLAPSGLNALVYCVGTGFGRLEGSHFTLLPGLVSAW